MNVDSAEAVLSSQIKDLNAILAVLPDRGASAAVSDGRIALTRYRDELVDRLQVLRGAPTEPTIARAVDKDTMVVQQEGAEENNGVGHCTVSLGVVNEESHQIHGRGLGTGPASNFPDRGFDIADLAERVMYRLITTNSDTPPVIDLTPRPPFNLGEVLLQLRAASREDSIIGLKKSCVVCEEPVEYFTAVYAPCGHDYCHVCIKEYFYKAAQDESLYPPSCCGEIIPMDLAEVFFTNEFIAYFEAKAVEWSSSNRTYCARKTCGAFVPPTDIEGDVAICTNCGFYTCTFCKEQNHEGRDCPNDEALQNLIETARLVGWQRCNRCKRFVELTQGCNHIYCPCGEEFCYVCARRWRTCTCPHWDEERLINPIHEAPNQQPIPLGQAQAPDADPHAPPPFEGPDFRMLLPAEDDDPDVPLEPAFEVPAEPGRAPHIQDDNALEPPPAQVQDPIQQNQI